MFCSRSLLWRSSRSIVQLLNNRVSLLFLEVLCLHISGHARKLHNQAVKLFGHLDLAAQPRSFSEPESEIQHICSPLA